MHVRIHTSRFSCLTLSDLVTVLPGSSLAGAHVPFARATSSATFPAPIKTAGAIQGPCPNHNRHRILQHRHVNVSLRPHTKIQMTSKPSQQQPATTPLSLRVLSLQQHPLLDLYMTVTAIALMMISRRMPFGQVPPETQTAGSISITRLMTPAAQVTPRAESIKTS